MPCYNIMKRIFLQGLLWLYLLGYGFTALSLEPGFLDFDNLPDTNFTCVGKVIGGYYADLETNCQMFHVCTIGQLDEPMDIRFLCLNGTVFDQETRVCERIDEVDCSKSEQFYSLNLELYGNSQPSNLEENYETEQPLIIKSTTTTTSTTTETPKKPSKFPYFTTLPPIKTTSAGQKTLHSHHYPVVNPNSPDIRFNPEEINISLHPGAPPDIRTKPFFTEKKPTSSDKKVQVVIASDSDKQSTASSALKSGYGRPSDVNFDFAYGDADDAGYGTETSLQEYQFHREFRPSQEYIDPLQNSGPHHYKPTTYHTPTTQKLQIFHSKSPTTSRNYYIPHLKPPAANQHSHYIQHRTEKPPQRLQLPLPLLPTLSPLTFSSPAPFSLQHHIETKRYTKEHIPPPRIIISASASVSDASGRRLNYSLGTIGAAQILEEPPSSYDDYKETDVVLDPFYHDVPKIKQNGRKRRKRSTEERLKHSDIIKNDEEAVTVLKFLFDWYRNEKTNPARLSTTPLSVPLPSEDIVKINDELGSEISGGESKEHENIDINFKSSDLFNKKSKYSIVGEDVPGTKDENATNGKNDQFFGLPDYVDDNYEPQTYKETYNKSNYQVESPEYNNEEAKNHSLALDYVDDNVEPIYYRERYPEDKEKSPVDDRGGKLNEVRKNSSVDVTTESNDEIIGTEQTRLEESTISLTPYNLAVEDFTVSANEFQKQPYNIRYNTNQEGFVEENSDKDDKKVVKTEVSFITRVSEEDGIIKSTTPSVLYIEVQDEALPKEEIKRTNDSLEELTPTPTTENIETNAISKNSRSYEKEVFTIKPIRTSSLIKNRNGNRGRRRFNTVESTTREPITFKNVLIEKLVKKPYTAKDDYDFLRTLSNVYSSTFRSAEDTTFLTKETEFYSTTTKELESTTTQIVKVTEEPVTEFFTNPIQFLSTESSTTTSSTSIPTTTSSTSIPITTSSTYVPTTTTSTTTPTTTTSTTTFSTTSSTTTTTLSTTTVPLTTTIPTTSTTTSTTTTPSPSSQSSERSSSRGNRRRGRTRFNGESTNKSSRRRISSRNHIDLEKPTPPPPPPVSNDENNQNESIQNSHDIIHTAESIQNHTFENSYDINVALPTSRHANVKNDINIGTSDIKMAKNKYETAETYSRPQDEALPHLKSIIEENSRVGDLQQAILVDKPKEIHLSTLNYVQEPFVKYTSKDTSNDFLISADESPDQTTKSKEVDFLSLEHTQKSRVNEEEDNSKVSSTEHGVETVDVQLPVKQIDKLSEINAFADPVEPKIQHSIEPYSEIVPTTTDQSYTPRYRGRGSKTFLNQFSLALSSQSLERSMSETTPVSHLVFLQNLGTPSSLPTESLVQTVSSTIAPSVGKNLFSQIDNIADIYATSFVPTEAVHITKKKQLKESESPEDESTLEPTTEIGGTEAQTKMIITVNEENDGIEDKEVDTTVKSDVEVTTIQEKREEQLPTTLWSETTTENIEKLEEKSILTNDYSTKLDTDKTEAVSTTETTLKAETVLPITPWVNKNLEKLVKDVESTTKGIIATAEKVLTNIGKPIEETFKNYFGYYGQENEVREATTETFGPGKIQESTQTYLETTKIVENLRNPEETTTDVNTYPPTYPETTKYVINDNLNNIADTKELGIQFVTSSDVNELNNTVIDTNTITTNNSSAQTPTTLELSATETTLTSQIEQHSSTTYSPRGSRRRNPKRKQDNQRNSYRHRFFSTEQFTRRPEGSRQSIEDEILVTRRPEGSRQSIEDEILVTRRPEGSRQTIEDEILAALTKSAPEITTRATILSQDVQEVPTDAPLWRSANPTQSKRYKEPLLTTPLSRKMAVKKHYFFNCFNKEIDKFYADPRDCRLFHYCTQGYSKNQLLDMKFVCDFNTFFDDENLICTKKKPKRCL